MQYVALYKVIDMREIAKAFDLSIEQIEAEIADLIVTKKIQAKIDSHSKVRYLHSKIYEINCICIYSYCIQGKIMRH